ncbi:2-dehydro-3-deoxygalactonokinase [Herbaspirillum hiltneri N3]|uniref:2-dehydro-3-deoxygalactonokinase n=1 Tax=Herbaspirillum hiltneri N3 TaxID=1262470 RepID=A0ABM5UWQ9_9BURK|nr:2-dehydro-3-deoxygalactonokinase [Herbaspirillum hiltneri]AKZ61625.1 2-dehydro-3-deoxygalactonokinase [Herbaspirillum hiltneri N3]
MSAIATRLIALDWGTTSLRAYRLGEDGAVLDKRGLPWGIMNLPVVEGDFSRAAGFAKAFDEACGDWLQSSPASPLIAAGMVGSAQGWREAGYVDIPLAVAHVGKQLTHVDLGAGRTLHIVPGLLQRAALPNVIRGEETQVVGALDTRQDSDDVLIGLPGTHSKWIRVQDRIMTHFDTFMTGEVYAVLSQHTILGRTMEHREQSDPAAFERGLRVASSEEGRAGVLSNIFSSRTLGLVGQLGASSQPDYLSGLLIGHEIAALKATRAAAACTAEPHIILIGDDKLCARYRTALSLYGLTRLDIAAQATERGLWKIARQAGLLN